MNTDPLSKMYQQVLIWFFLKTIKKSKLNLLRSIFLIPRHTKNFSQTFSRKVKVNGLVHTKQKKMIRSPCPLSTPKQKKTFPFRSFQRVFRVHWWVNENRKISIYQSALTRSGGGGGTEERERSIFKNIQTCPASLTCKSNETKRIQRQNKHGFFFCFDDHKNRRGWVIKKANIEKLT